MLVEGSTDSDVAALFEEEGLRGSPDWLVPAIARSMYVADRL